MKKNLFFSIIFSIIFITSFASAATLNVGTNQTYSTIQSAIDNASVGDTINVSAGTYTEDLVINISNLTLTTSETATIKGASNVPDSDGYAADNPNILILSNNVSISGFNLEAHDFEQGNHTVFMTLKGTNHEIINNNFSIGLGESGSAPSVGIVSYCSNELGCSTAYSGVDISGLKIYLNDFNSLPGNGSYEAIYLNPDIGTNPVYIYSNTFKGKLHRGIATERNNTFIGLNNFSTNYSSDWQAIRVTNWYGYLVGNIYLAGNTILDFNVGVRIGGGLNAIFSNVTIEENEFTNTSTAILIHNSSEEIYINYNNLINNTLAINNSDGSNLNASYNYWGTYNETEINSLISGNVTYSPWTNSPPDETPDAPVINLTATITQNNLISFVLNAIGNLPDFFRLSLDNLNFTEWIEWGHNSSINISNFDITNISLGENSSDGEKTIYVDAKDYANNTANSIENATVTYDTTASTNLSELEITESRNVSGIYYISPNSDGVYDNITIDLKYSEDVDATIYVENSSGSKIKEIYASVSPVTNPAAKNWNGTNESGSIMEEGTYYVKTNVSDSVGNSIVLSVATVVIQYPTLSISSQSPSTNPIIKRGDEQIFSATAADSELNNLTYSWYINSNLNQSGTNNSFAYTFSSEGNYIILVNVSNPSGISSSTNWNVTISDTPVTTSFDGTESTNFSAITNLSAATGIVLSKSSKGKIDFGSQTLDLSNVIDIENNVKIESGIVAINSSRYSQLNKPATITLTGLSYSTVPKIYYSSGFTTDSSQITTECTTCNITNYTKSPTANGQVTFTVPSFSSYKVSGSGIKYDVELFDDLDVCENGIQGNVKLEVSDPDEGDEFNPNDEINLDLEITNDFSESKRYNIYASLFNVDEDDTIEKTKITKERVKSDDSESFEFYMTVPEDIDDSDDYFVFIKVDIDDEEETQCNYEIVDVSLERESHKVEFKELSLNKEIFNQGELVSAEISLINLGSSDEDGVYVEVVNTDLGISERSIPLDLEEYDKDDSAVVNIEFNIPYNTTIGEYPLRFNLVFDDGDERVSTIETISVVSIPAQIETTTSLNTNQQSSITGAVVKEESSPLFLVNLILILDIIVVAVLILRLRKR